MCNKRGSPVSAVILSLYLILSLTFGEEAKEPVKLIYERTIEGKNFEEVKNTLLLYLKENDLTVFKVINSKEGTLKYTIIYVYNEDDLKRVINNYPRLGNIFPSRIVIREDMEGNVHISIVNAHILSRVYKGTVPEDILNIIKDNYEYLKSIIDQI